MKTKQTNQRSDRIVLTAKRSPSQMMVTSFLFAALLLLFSTVQSQMVTTDASDYPPGSVVTIDGAGFLSGETVSLQVTHVDTLGDNGESEAHDSWQVTADADGNFQATWTVPDAEDELDALLLLTADGETSGFHAETTFWDSGVLQNQLLVTPIGAGVCLPSSGSVTHNFIVTPQRNNAGNATVSFSTSTLPAGVTASFSPATVSATGTNAFPSTTMTLTIQSTATVGSFTLRDTARARNASGVLTGSAGSVLITLNVNKAPNFSTCQSDITVSTDPGRCDASVNYTVYANGFPEPSLTYSYSGATTGSGTVTGAPITSVFNKGETNVSIVATNTCGSAICSFKVIVNDDEAPSINCPSDIDLNACTSTAEWNAPVASDNCPGLVIQQTEGPPSGSVFDNGTTTTIGYTATDEAGHSVSCSFTVTRASALSVNAGDDETTYYGYTLDLSVMHTATASGGSGGYSYAWTMDRPLLCNQINTSGDESFSAGSCTGTTCPATGSPAINPYCSGSETVLAKLIDTALICVTVTDADGCTATDCFILNAEDVRCFAGNSGIQKTKICHNGTTICVDDNAIQAHLDHGDYLGKCSAHRAENTQAGFYELELYPNPADHLTHLEFDAGAESGSLRISVVNMLGQICYSELLPSFTGTLDRDISTEHMEPGAYFVTLEFADQMFRKQMMVQR